VVVPVRRNRFFMFFLILFLGHMLYSEDNLLIGKYYVENRTNVNFNHISPYAVKALIATEDVRFYEHEGVDKISYAEGIFQNCSAGTP